MIHGIKHLVKNINLPSEGYITENYKFPIQPQAYLPNMDSQGGYIYK